MHTVVRSYSGKGAKELVDSIEKTKNKSKSFYVRSKAFITII
jgi:hypothetical protein